MLKLDLILQIINQIDILSTILMKDELGGKMTKIFRLKVKTCSYLKDDSSEDKKAKGAKKMCHKKKT